MDKSQLFGLLTILFFLSILFTPLGTKVWMIPFFGGLIFGILWARSK